MRFKRGRDDEAVFAERTLPDWTPFEWIKRGSCRRRSQAPTFMRYVDAADNLEEEIQCFCCAARELRPLMHRARDLYNLGVRQLSDIWLLGRETQPYALSIRVSGTTQMRLRMS